MTRKDFELIARVVNNTYTNNVQPDVDRDQIAEAFARELTNVNPRFDAAKFLQACGHSDYWPKDTTTL